MFMQRPIAQRRSSAPREHMMCWMRRAAGLASPRPIVQRRFEFPWNSVECFTKEFREPCSLRGTGGIFAIELLGGFAVHRVCHGVVGFIMKTTRRIAVSSNGKWPQRAKAMKSENGSLTYSGKPKCTTSHSTQLKARTEGSLSRNVQTVPVRLEEQIG